MNYSYIACMISKKNGFLNKARFLSHRIIILCTFNLFFDLIICFSLCSSHNIGKLNYSFSTLAAQSQLTRKFFCLLQFSKSRCKAHEIFRSALFCFHIPKAKHPMVKYCSTILLSIWKTVAVLTNNYTIVGWCSSISFGWFHYIYYNRVMVK